MSIAKVVLDKRNLKNKGTFLTEGKICRTVRLNFTPSRKKQNFFRTRRQGRLNYQSAQSLIQSLHFYALRRQLEKQARNRTKTRKNKFLPSVSFVFSVFLELNVKISSLRSEREVGKIGSKIGKIGNLAFARRRFLKNFL